MLGDSRRDTEARTEYEKLTQDFPELPEPFNNLAVIQAAQGRLDHARDLLETALRNDPTYRTAHANLGDVYARLALRSYTSAASAPRVDDGLVNKLRMARELVAASPSHP
jgi:Flp pilus assembly protein TadD